ncbi:MAG: hypothetical protein LC687_01240, partial [Actinobacteria bacterium]|nr:hypothetical protein [Actinomycetota bacterium]MCA1806480.1 hypothetical protein [Actinomycetota bacterium]
MFAYNGSKHMNMDAKETLAYWIAERERVRVAREADLPKPWSMDPVFQDTYFCNVRREDDRVTRYIRHVYSPHRGHPSFTANIILSRLVNKIDSLEKLGYMEEFDQGLWDSVMGQAGSWGSAYLVSTNGVRQRKHEYVAGLLQQAFEQLYGWPATTAYPTLVGAHRRLQAVRGLASFMAAQVVADLKNTQWHPLSVAPDWSTFSAPGPGSLRGLAWFHDMRVSPKTYHEKLASTRGYLYTTDVGQLVKGLCNQDLQNCMCEYDKYMRVSTGVGRSKRKYNGRNS